MQEVFKDVSTNGRSGLAIVAESDVAFPAKGVLTLLGIFEGVPLTQTVNGFTSAAKLKPLAALLLLRAHICSPTTTQP